VTQEIQPIAIENRLIGPGHPALVVGEVAQAHDGSLGTAHAFIDAIADAGADAVKFQTHIAAAESSPHRAVPSQIQPSRMPPAMTTGSAWNSRRKAGPAWPTMRISEG